MSRPTPGPTRSRPPAGRSRPQAAMEAARDGEHGHRRSGRGRPLLGLGIANVVRALRPIGSSSAAGAQPRATSSSTRSSLGLPRRVYMTSLDEVEVVPRKSGRGQARSGPACTAPTRRAMTAQSVAAGLLVLADRVLGRRFSTDSLDRRRRGRTDRRQPTPRLPGPFAARVHRRPRPRLGRPRRDGRPDGADGMARRSSDEA